MNVLTERLSNGILKENPSFVLMLGMCPTLAVTTSSINGLGMGLSTTVVLVMSNMFISLLRKVIPDRVRVPAYIVVVASFVTMVDFLLAGFLPDLYSALGVFIPLIVVNCIILGRAEAYASKNPVIPSIFDGIGMGIGFSLSLTVIGTARELLGNGSVFGIQLLPLADPAAGVSGYTPISIFVLAPGGFMMLAVLVAVMSIVRKKMEAKGKPLAPMSGCLTGEGCASCVSAKGCGTYRASVAAAPAPVATSPAPAPAAPAPSDEQKGGVE